MLKPGGKFHLSMVTSHDAFALYGHMVNHPTFGSYFEVYIYFRYYFICINILNLFCIIYYIIYYIFLIIILIFTCIKKYTTPLRQEREIKRLLQRIGFSVHHCRPIPNMKYKTDYLIRK